MTTVLVAARGFAARRALESVRALGLTPVGVRTATDLQCGHLDPGLPSARVAGYHDVASVVAAARAVGARLVHPGCAGLAEDPLLPEQLAAHGIGFVGPPSAALARARSKSRAVTAAARLGVPVQPHAVGDRAVLRLARRVGLPLALKPDLGCLGGGLTVVTTSRQLSALLAASSGTAWYAERFVPAARVVGVTVAVDHTGGAAVLGERETLLTAGSLKLLDATPVLDVPDGVLAAMRDDAIRLALRLRLRNVATVEFLVTSHGYSFMEVNPRLTGAFPMTEVRTGDDLIALQLRIALGDRLSAAEVGADRHRHVVEGRFYRRPGTPAASLLSPLRLPEDAPGIRTACVLRPGPADLDSLLLQVIAVAGSRPAALDRLGPAVSECLLGGVDHLGDELLAFLAAPAGARLHDPTDDVLEPTT